MTYRYDFFAKRNKYTVMVKRVHPHFVTVNGEVCGYVRGTTRTLGNVIADMGLELLDR